MSTVINSYEEKSPTQEDLEKGEGPGFFVGAKAFLDLSGKVDGIHDKLHSEGIEYHPVYKPVGGSGTAPVSGNFFVAIPQIPARGRTWNILKVILAATSATGTDVHTPALQAVTQPAVPASTVAQQNTNNQPVLVTLAGFTATQVFVNGIQVGTTNGTYLVPAGGSISVTYTVQGTWTWTGTTTTATADVYAGALPDISGPTVDNAIISAANIPSVTNITKHVDWCPSGETIFAVIIGAQPGQQVSLIARVAEYPVEAVEAMRV